MERMSGLACFRSRTRCLLNRASENLLRCIALRLLEGLPLLHLSDRLPVRMRAWPEVLRYGTKTYSGRGLGTPPRASHSFPESSLMDGESNAQLIQPRRLCRIRACCPRRRAGHSDWYVE